MSFGRWISGWHSNRNLSLAAGGFSMEEWELWDTSHIWQYIYNYIYIVYVMFQYVLCHVSTFWTVSRSDSHVNIMLPKVCPCVGVYEQVNTLLWFVVAAPKASAINELWNRWHIIFSLAAVQNIALFQVAVIVIFIVSGLCLDSISECLQYKAVHWWFCLTWIAWIQWHGPFIWQGSWFPIGNIGFLIVLLWVICRHFLSQCVSACERPWRCPLCWSSEWRLFWRGQFCTSGSLELLTSYSMLQPSEQGCLQPLK